MKPRCEEKLERELKNLETQLIDRLRQVLPRAAETGVNLFANSGFNPHNLLQGHLSAEAEEFLAMARKCIALRERLCLEVMGSVGELYLRGCSEGADLSNEHRRGPRRLAAWLLRELEGLTAYNRSLNSDACKKRAG